MSAAPYVSFAQLAPRKTGQRNLVRFRKPENIRKQTNWNGLWENVCLVNANNWLKALAQNIPPLYVESLPISKAKFEDLQVLKIFCSPSAQKYFDNLSKAEHADDGSDEEYCD